MGYEFRRKCSLVLQVHNTPLKLVFEESLTNDSQPIAMRNRNLVGQALYEFRRKCSLVLQVHNTPLELVSEVSLTNDSQHAPRGTSNHMGQAHTEFSWFKACSCGSGHG